MKTKPNTNKRPSCPRCGAKGVYYRKFTASYLCRTCGKVFRWNAETDKYTIYRLMEID